MKKALLMIAVLLSLTACEKAILNDVDTEDGQTEVSCTSGYRSSVFAIHAVPEHR